MKPEPEANNQNAPAGVLLQPVVSLCGFAMSENAKSKIINLYARAGLASMRDLAEAFTIGFTEGKSAQANAKLSGGADNPPARNL